MKQDNVGEDQVRDEITQLRERLSELEHAREEAATAESRRQETEKRFNDIAENALQWIWEVDSEWRYTYVSPVVEDILGYAADEVLGMRCHDLFDPDDKEDQRVALLEMFASREPFREFVSRNVRKSGALVWLATSGVPILDEQEALLGYRGASTDITARIKSEEEWRRLEEQMLQVQKLESLGAMVGGIAHDFNNLLLGVLGNAELALLELGPASPAGDMIVDIQRASLRAANLCKKLLLYSGKGQFATQPTNINGVIQDVSGLLQTSVPKKTAVKYQLDTDLPMVSGDPSQIRQVIMNLVANSAEAIGAEGGVITIATMTRDCDRAYLSSTYLDENLPAGRYVVLEIADTGDGVDEEAKGKLFDPFFTTKVTEDGQKQARGLGLAAVLGVIRGHRGAMKVTSVPGQGATFTILFPRIKSQASEIEPSSPSDKEWRGSGTVLVIDDEDTTRSVARRMLEKLGFSVLTAAAGREGAAIYREHADEISVVLLDLAMPDMDGGDTFRELCRIREDVRVILSSGYDALRSAERFTGVGVAGFLEKPYRMEDLAGKLRDIVGR